MTTSKPRSLYIDNLRIFLIILVILLHSTITYVGIGGWYYIEHQAEGLVMIPFVMFLFTLQSFFMGLFFLISAYFTVPSYNRKGGWEFLKDRFVRLGIPLVVFYFFINSLTIYILAKYIHNYEYSFGHFYMYDQGFGFGPMWFVETLIYFTLIYALIRFLIRKRKWQEFVEKPFPKVWQVIAFAILIGLISFTARIWFSLGYNIPHTGLQVPYFSQYIAMLILGVFVYKYKWFDKISFKYGIRWLIFALFLIFIVLPLFLYFGGGKDNNLEPYMGGLHWQSMFMAVLEQMLGISLMISLVGIFKAKLNTQDKFKKALSASAYTVYVIHPLILVAIAVGLRNWDLSPYLKLVILAPVMIAVCFTLAYLIRGIPYFKRVL